MKVIRRDNLNRDYQPERLITVSIDVVSAQTIKDALNRGEGEYCLYWYDIVEDDYILNTESMYDVSTETKPDNFEFVLHGLNALVCSFNINKRK